MLTTIFGTEMRSSLLVTFFSVALASNVLAQCAHCDVNDDGIVGVNDFYLVRSGEIDPIDFDESGSINFSDYLYFIRFGLRTAQGDSNWDGVFDTRDLMQVFQSAKYDPTFSDQIEATWTTGDWDGDGFFNGADLVMVFNGGGFRQQPYRADPIPGLPDPRLPPYSESRPLVPGSSASRLDGVTVTYSQLTGEVSVDAGENPMTTIELQSSNGIFMESDALEGIFDVQMTRTIFRLEPAGFSSISLGPVVQPGLAPDQLRNDLLVNGSFLSGGGLDLRGRDGPFLWFLPTGDFNTDGKVGLGDIEMLTLAVRDRSADSAFDVNLDGVVNQEDRFEWIESAANSFLGDSNLDGEFNSADLVNVFQAAEFEDGIPLNSTWLTGDWNGDAEFTSTDLVLAFQDGGYELGPRVAAAVPEPSTALLFALAATFSVSRTRRKRF